METLRVVVTGTVGAGKSTFVRTASEIEVIEVERMATDETLALKQNTTVAFDFGRLAIGSKMDLHIYGTPGQARFDFMWDILIKGAHAYILLVAAHRPSGLHYAHEILSFMNQRVQVPMMIGLTHMDCAGALSPEEVLKNLGQTNPQTRPKVVIVNPNERASVVEALRALTALVRV
ncbi:MAG TPA: ATP/GTP-binding protein [Cyanophyceae cyanobacterium]